MDADPTLLPQPRKPITPERADELMGYGAHWAWDLASDPDPLTLSEMLVVIGTAAGVALGAVERPIDRQRLLTKLSRLAMKTAATARDVGPAEDEFLFEC